MSAPGWLDVLREACERNTQAAVGRRLGYSASVISSVLSGTYRGDLARVERAVRGALMGDRVDCPVLGSIRLDTCIGAQRRTLTEARHELVARLWRACRSGCVHSRLSEADRPAEARWMELELESC